MAAACNDGPHNAELYSEVLADLKMLVGEELKVSLGLRIRTICYTRDAWSIGALQMYCWD